jgi:hypothetical protein
MPRNTLLRRSLIVPVIALSALLAGTPHAARAEPTQVGTIVTVTGQVLDGSGSDARQLRPSMTIVSGQTIQTGPGSGVSIAAAGGAKLNVGPGSQISLEQTASGSGDVAVMVNLMSGSFRFSTGRLGLATYTIRTPSGTLVANDAVVSFDVASGAIAVESGSVQTETSSGRTVVVSAGQVLVGVDAQGQPVVKSGSAFQGATNAVTSSLSNGRVASLQQNQTAAVGPRALATSPLATIVLRTVPEERVSPN